MRHLLPAVLAATLLATCVAPTLAATQTQYEKKAVEAAGTGQRTISVYVDVDLGARKAGSAKELNQAHQAFNRHGFEVVDVVGYTENGDLQGFFVTYAKH